MSFIELVFHLLAPGRPFLMNWHIQALAYVLEQVRLGRIKRLIINLPPRFLKSHIASIALPAFALGHAPSKRIMVISYGLDLATKFTYESSMVMSSRRYKAIFPGTRLLRRNDSEIVTSRNGYRLATSIDGPLTGRGADLIVVDDPHKLSDAESDKKLEHVSRFTGTPSCREWMTPKMAPSLLSCSGYTLMICAARSYSILMVGPNCGFR